MTVHSSLSIKRQRCSYKNQQTEESANAQALFLGAATPTGLPERRRGHTQWDITSTSRTWYAATDGSYPSSVTFWHKDSDGSNATYHSASSGGYIYNNGTGSTKIGSSTYDSGTGILTVTSTRDSASFWIAFDSSGTGVKTVTAKSSNTLQYSRSGGTSAHWSVDW